MVTMRAFLLVVALAVLAASPALAAKKRARATDTLRVTVLPFEGRGAGGADLKEALELELELSEHAIVVESGALERDLGALGPEEGLEPRTLSALMKKREIDVVVRGSRGPGERLSDALVVAAYAKDGKPHFFKELPLGSEPDVTAAGIGAPLKDALADWKNQRAVRLPNADDRGSRVSVDDVLADEDEPKRARTERAPVSEDTEEPPASEGKKGKKGKKSLDFNDDEGAAPVDTASEPDTTEPERKSRRSRLDDDAPAREARDREPMVDDEGRKVDDEDAPSVPRAGHMVALSASFRGATWQYGFTGSVDLGAGTEVVESVVSVPFVAGAGLRIDFWPLEWVGVEADASVGAMRLVLNSEAGPAIEPGEFVAYQMGGAAVAKVRYVLSVGLPGLAFGGRLGYRYWGATTETQTAPGGAQITVVPGYALHALSTGVEVDLPLRIADRRLEIELRVDALPATYYEESPDNPGQSSLAIGWYSALLARYEIIGGVFAEVGITTVGAVISYEGEPEKPRNVLASGNQPVPLQGGDVRNFAIGFDLGVGWMY
jgi:hypothetical protein